MIIVGHTREETGIKISEEGIEFIIVLLAVVNRVSKSNALSICHAQFYPSTRAIQIDRHLGRREHPINVLLVLRYRRGAPRADQNLPPAAAASAFSSRSLTSYAPSRPMPAGGSSRTNLSAAASASGGEEDVMVVG